LLGLEIDYDQDRGTMRLYQTAYIESILSKNGMASCNGVGSPLLPGHVLGTPDDLDTADPSRSNEFLAHVGEMLWLAQSVHAPLALVAGLLSRYGGKRTDECWRIVKHAHKFLRRHATPV
jgi:hypothetical protein